MTSIDERIVSMKFNNGQFLSGIAATLNALANLKKGLNVESSAKGLDKIGSSMAKLPPPQLAAGIQGISGRFAALSVVGITALSNITTAALAAGSQLLKSLTVDPIKMGLEEYETNLNSIQTILANTGLEGDKGLGKVNAALEELNHYADQTIYNFSEMARNIGTFTAAGVDLDTSTAAIKGIANLAAVSGSNAQQASTAMYQLSQSLAAGKVTLEDWNSVVNAGMGGKVFQEALKETARVHGVAVDSIIKDAGSFRNSLQEGWITGEIMTETLSKFTGDLTEAQLKTMGYNEEQIAGIVKMGKTASDAATKVKTMSQLINTLQESVQSSWSQTWQYLFGNFNEAKDLFTDVNNVLGGLIGASGDARNKVLEDWNKLGGRTAIIDGIGNAFNAVLDVLKPIQTAFREIFPATTGKQLYDLSVRFKEFTETLKIGATDSENLRRTFAGVFAVFSIFGQVIQGVFSVLGKLFGTFSQGTGGLLDFTGGVGDFLVSLDQAIKKSEGFTNFFETLGNVLAVPIQLLMELGNAIRAAFEGFDGGGSNALEGSLDRISVRLEPFAALGELAAKAWSGLGNVLERIWAFMAPFTQLMSDMFSRIGEAISTAVTEGDFSKILDAVNVGLLGALVLAIKKFLDGGLLGNLGDTDGFLEGITEAFGGLNDTLGAMQANLKAGTLIKIAGAVALLAASVAALSLIDSGSLTRALTALTVMFIQLGAAMAAFEATTSITSVLKLGPMAAGLVLLAAAILILSAAVKVLSTMSWEELAKGLTGVVVLLGALAGAMRLMPASIPGAAAIFIVAPALLVLAGALKIMATLSWEEIAKGLITLAGALAIIAGGLYLMTGALPGAAAMLVVAPALILLAAALKIMATLGWEEIGKGMTILAGSLLILAAGLTAMIVSLPGAAALLVAAAALLVLAPVMLLFGTMSWEAIGKGLTLLAGTLLLLAVGLTAMIVALPGAAALIVAAGALAILAPVLLAFGSMSWGEIGKGLTMLAASLAIIGIAGAVLTPVIPTLLGLGAAIALIGIGTLAAGAGLLAFSVGLTALSVAGAAGTAALVAIVTALISLIPMAMNAVAKGIVLMANVIGSAGPQFTRAMTTLLNSLINAINRLGPKIIDMVWNLAIKMANRIADGYPKFVDAGLRLITGVLNGIANNIGGIVTAAVSIITNFINALSANLPRITQAGANLVISLVESLAGAINANAGRMRAAGQDLAFAIVDGMTGGLLSGGSSVISAAVDMASSALNAAKSALGIHSPSREFRKVGAFAVRGFVQGLTGSRAEVRAAGKAMREALIDLVKGTREDVKESEARLKDLRKRRKEELKDAEGDAKKRLAINKRFNEAIKKEEAKLAKYRTANRRAESTWKYYRDRLDDERRALEKLASRYESVTKKLDAANQKLADAKRTRDDYNRSIRDQYSAMDSITEETKVTDYLANMREQVEETNKFAILLQELRRRGLDDKAYEHLLSQGAAALPFAEELIAGGQASIDELNSLGSQMDSAASKLGKTASKELYQAGVDAAQGLVDGLEKQQRTIGRLMDKIADQMVRSIKKRLGIKSPSRKFKEVGGWSVEGLIAGLKASSSGVVKASEDIGDSALTALEQSMRDVGKGLRADMDMTPTIRPVLDLSQVRKDSSQIPGIMTPNGLKVEASYSRASVIAQEDRAARLAQVEREAVTSTPEERLVLKYEQNISSPKATSNAEIYRTTKNTLSQIKKNLPVSKGATTK